MRNLASISPFVSVLAAALLFGCGDNSDDGGSGGNGSGNSSGSDGPEGSSSSNGDGNSSGFEFSEDDRHTGQASEGNGEEEICDGIDNNEDGIIDNRDIDGDGLCDCLKIATIGRIGIHGAGNVFKRWLNERGAEGARFLENRTITDELIAEFQVIVVLNTSTELGRGDRPETTHHAFQPSEVQAMDNWVSQGGGVMTTIGYQGKEDLELVNVNELLSFSGMGYDPAWGDADELVSDWADHPIGANMGVARMNNGVRPLTGVGRTIAWDEESREALQVLEHNDGRIAVWADEWITYDEDWQDTETLDIELFWLNLFKWLSPPEECQVPIPTIR